MMITSMERIRAEVAVHRVNSHLQKYASKTSFWNSYSNVVNSLPAKIRMHGLARALAAELAAASMKDTNEKLARLAVLDDLCEGVLRWHEAIGRRDEYRGLERAIATLTLQATDPSTVADGMSRRASALIEETIALTFRDYTVLQREVMHILIWFKSLSAPHKPKDADKSKMEEVKNHTQLIEEAHKK